MEIFIVGVIIILLFNYLGTFNFNKFVDDNKVLFSKLKEDDNLGALLTTSAKNKAINYYNRHKRETQYINTLQDESYDQEIGLDSGLLDKIKNILSKKEYEVFILHILGEYSFKEISEIKKIPLGTLTWTYQEARKKLEIELGGKNHD